MARSSPRPSLSGPCVEILRAMSLDPAADSMTKSWAKGPGVEGCAAHEQVNPRSAVIGDSPGAALLRKVLMCVSQGGALTAVALHWAWGQGALPQPKNVKSHPARSRVQCPHQLSGEAEAQIKGP